MEVSITEKLDEKNCKYLSIFLYYKTHVNAQSYEPSMMGPLYHHFIVRPGTW